MKTFTYTLLALYFSINSFGQTPVSRYTFENGAKDIIGGNDGVLGSQLIQVKDRLGNTNGSYYYDSTLNSRITIPINNFLFNSFTYSFWFRSRSFPALGKAQALVCVGEALTANQSVIISNSSGTLQLAAISYYNNTSSDNVIHDTQLDTLSWNHVVLTRDSSSKSLKLYLNGILAKSQSTNQSAAAYGNTNNGAYLIGGRGPVQFFHGFFDDLRIYNYALSSSEVATLYNTEKTLPVGGAEQVGPRFDKVILSPNPGNGRFQVSGVSGSCRTTIFDLQGRAIHQTDDKKLELDIAPGIYYCVFSYGGNNIETKRLVIVK